MANQIKCYLILGNIQRYWVLNGVPTDHFQLTIRDLTPPTSNSITKHADIAKMYDVFGWFSPSTIKVKILLQKAWEEVGWDDPVPSSIYDVWFQWRTELPLLSVKHIPRCYFDKRLR